MTPGYGLVPMVHRAAPAPESQLFFMGRLRLPYQVEELAVFVQSDPLDNAWVVQSSQDITLNRLAIDGAVVVGCKLTLEDELDCDLDACDIVESSLSRHTDETKSAGAQLVANGVSQLEIGRKHLVGEVLMRHLRGLIVWRPWLRITFCLL